nr:MAG TPA: hypothetical protein [Caudoviricetes sp.]
MSAYFILCSSLIFLPYSVIIKVAGVRLPAHLLGCLSSGSVEGAATLFIYSSMMRLTLSRSSSSVSHFSMSSRIAFSNASVTFTSFIHLTPFKKLFGFALHSYITPFSCTCQ